MDYNEPSIIAKSKVVENILFQELKHFMASWRKQAKSRVLVQGNILKESAIKIVENALDTLQLQKVEEVCKNIIL